jgi:AcrR family transcriptional regulator
MAVQECQVENERLFSYSISRRSGRRGTLRRTLSQVMSPRPRETSDAELLAAASRVMQRRSPTQLTLADVAKEAGVVPATLIQRFSTKRNLILSLCRAAPESCAAAFAAARAKHKSLLDALIELYAAGTSFAPTPEAMANGLAWLQNDLTDPDFHAITLEQFRIIRDETKKLLDDAVVTGELRPCDTAQLARLIQHTNGGAMLAWAVYRNGPVANYVRRELTALLAPYRSDSRKSSFKKSARASL